MAKRHHPSMRRAAGLAVAAFLWCTFLFGGFHRWTSHGPDGGEVWALAGDSASEDLLYAGSTFGGAWRSFDGGASWEPLDTPFSTSSVMALATHPSIPGVVYAGTYFGGLWKSVDAGTTWTELPANLVDIQEILIDPTSPDRIFASGGSSGAARSLDGGASWTFLPIGGHLAFHPSTPNTIYAATSSGIFKSVDGGDSFMPSNVGIPADTTAVSIAIDPNVTSTLYAGAANQLYKSVDSGASWTPTIQRAPLRLLILPGSPSTIYAALGDGVAQSHDGAATWTAGLGLEWQMVTILVNASTPGRLFAGTRGAGVYRSDDGGLTWSPRTAGLHGCWAYDLAIDPLDPRHVFAALDGGSLARTSDAGESWQPANAGLTRPNVKAVALDPLAPTTAYAGVEASGGPSVFKSVNGGTTWFEIGGSTMQYRNVRSLAIDPANSASILAGAALGSVMRSDDGGMTWEYSNTGLDFVAPENMAFDPSQPGTVYAATALGVFKSTDGGRTWEPKNNGIETDYGTSATAVAIDPRSPATLYAGLMFGYPIFKSVDGGESWSRAGSGILGFSRIFDVVPDPLEPDTVYAGGDQGVWVTRNGGESWDLMSEGLGGPPVVQSLTIDAAGRMLHAGTWGAGVAEFQLHFFDVDLGDPFRPFIETLALAGVTAGCGHADFCPDALLTRAQAAVWLLRARHGSAYTPPPASGAVFADVPADAFAAAWIEELAAEGITSGCGGGGFCPDASLTRAEAAVFLLRAEHGPDYVTPPATGTVFSDVPADAFAAAWIEALAAEGITSGCGGGSFCPDAPTTRGQAAVFVVRTFDLH